MSSPSLRQLDIFAQMVAAGSAARCAQVRSYKYTSPDDTLLESLILNRFWAFAVRAFVPEWVAPNLLTFVGFLHALAAYALLLAHSPALDACTGRPNQR